MAKRRSNKFTPRRQLSQQVERIASQSPASPDTTDPDVLAYLNEFLKSYAQIGPLEDTSLLSAESAQRALVYLEKKQAEINAHLRTARALKKVLKNGGEN